MNIQFWHIFAGPNIRNSYLIASCGTDYVCYVQVNLAIVIKKDARSRFLRSFWYGLGVSLPVNAEKVPLYLYLIYSF